MFRSHSTDRLCRATAEEGGGVPGSPSNEPKRGGNRFKFLVCVDDSRHSRVALRFATLRARNSGGLVALLHVIDPPEYQHLVTVAEAMEQERREEAEELLHRLALDVQQCCGLTPELHIRQGNIGEQILSVIREDTEIDALVVGAAPADQRRGRLISWLAGQLAGNLDIPLVIVPGNLTDEQLERMT